MFRVTAQVEKNFDQSKKQKAIVERKRAAGVEMELGDVNLKIKAKQRKVVAKSGGDKKSKLASILFSWIKNLENIKSVFYFADFYIPTRAIGNSRSFWSLYINLLIYHFTHVVHTEKFSLKKGGHFILIL